MDVCDKKITENEFEKTLHDSDSEFESDLENIIGDSTNDNKKIKTKKKKISEEKNDSENSNNDDFSDEFDYYFDDNESAVNSEFSEPNSENFEKDYSDEDSINSDNETLKNNSNKKQDKKTKRDQKNLENKGKNKKIKLEVHSSDNSDDDGDDDSISDVSQNKDDSGVNKKLWEDIYGRTRDETGNVVQTYVPPHLRNKTDNNVNVKSNQSKERLKKQLQGLLNRLAESTMVFVSNKVIPNKNLTFEKNI